MYSRRRCISLIVAASVATAQDALASPSCPNLSGKYTLQGEDGQVHIAIEQHGCGHIDIVRRSTYLGATTTETHALKLDGQEQKDSPWLGGREQYRTSARFVGSQLQIRARTTGGASLKMIYSLTPSRDLLEEARTGGRGVPVLAVREK